MHCRSGARLEFDGRKTRPPEYEEKEVVAFLGSVGSKGFLTWISRTPNDDIYAAADLDSIPAVLNFDARGAIVRSFVDAGETAGIAYKKDVIPLVAKMVQ